jgi:ATP-dependent DNA ligase
MMAESAKTPFDSADWIFEIKLDGYRLALLKNPALVAERVDSGEKISSNFKGSHPS